MEQIESLMSKYMMENEKQNHYSGDTGPYFPNFTIFLLFLWFTKHQIGTSLSRNQVWLYVDKTPTISIFVKKYKIIMYNLLMFEKNLP